MSRKKHSSNIHNYSLQPKQFIIYKFIVFCLSIQCCTSNQVKTYTPNELQEIFVYNYYTHNRKHIKTLIKKYNLDISANQKSYALELQKHAKNSKKWKAFIAKSISLYSTIHKNLHTTYHPLTENNKHYIQQKKSLASQKLPQNYIAIFHSKRSKKLIKKEFYKNKLLITREYYSEKTENLIYRETHTTPKKKQYFYMNKEL